MHRKGVYNAFTKLNPPKASLILCEHSVGVAELVDALG